MFSRFFVFLEFYFVMQSFYYSYFTVLCLLILLCCQFPYVWSFPVVYAVMPFIIGLRPVGLAFYNLVSFLKILKLSFPTGLPSIWFSFIMTPFMFIGECSSQMIRPVTLILRLLVNLSFAYLISLTLGSMFMESLMSFGFSLGFFFNYAFSTFYFFYEIFMCFLLTYVSHVMLLSLISDNYHVLEIRYFG